MPESEANGHCANLGKTDLYFLLRYLLGRDDIEKQWLLDRCKEVRENPNGYLDLWAREHYKSTIITFGLTIQDIINDPEITIGIFSITRPNAKKFLQQIREELTKNERLKELYPDVLYNSPEKEAPKWSLDDGIVVKREGNPKESTVEAHGLVDGMPTGRHFKIRIYDDVIDEKNVTSPDMIHKAVQAWELSLNLGSAQECKHYGEKDIERYVGTRYHYNDPYAAIMKRKAAKERIYPGTHNGKPDGDPVLWDEEFIKTKRRKMGSYIFACQILQDPKADEVQGFKESDIKYWGAARTSGLNVYILCDPAGEKKKENDYTVFMVIGLGPDRNYYLIDMVRDRLNLKERAKTLFWLHRNYNPLAVGYEKVGMQSDIEHYEDVMERENYRFSITPLKAVIPKNDRIKKLIPLFEDGRFFIPKSIQKTDYQGRNQELVDAFINDEFKAFPVAEHDDMLDCMAKILEKDMLCTFPKPKQYYRGPQQAGNWMSM